MLNRFKKFVGDNNLVKPGDKVLLAVSGGIDSMVMTHLFQQLGNETAIAHCNFSLRAGDSDKDEALVREFAENHKIKLYSIRFNTKSFARESGLSVQMAARELRYKWFEDIRKENGLDIIAVAHNLNDNIETLIINLTRGTGITGMTGMKSLSNRIIRPLLFATRDEITAYCIQHRINFREDKSNADTKYTRNKIRHLIIPVLKEINPAIESTLNDTVERFAGINEIVSEYISIIRETVSEERGEFIVFNISLLKTYLHNRTVLFELFKPFGINNLQLPDLINVTEGKTGGQIFTGSHRIIKNRKEIIVSHEDAEKETLYNILNINELKNVPCILSASYIRITDGLKIPSDTSVAYIDSGKLTYPLIIRKWKTGDLFYPFGMNKKKKLSDYFIDAKYSKFDKEKILILESAGDIVWIIGERLDNRYRITDPTKKALIIKAQGAGHRVKNL